MKFPEADEGEAGRLPVGSSPCVIHPTSGNKESITNDFMLIDWLVSKSNMTKAYHHVVKNKGAPGVDGVTVEDLKQYLQDNWEDIKQKLLEGRYTPQAVKRVEIPKPDGGVRKLGIPTCVDRLIQQALNQVLSPIFERSFSDSSYGFRPGRQASMAIHKAKAYIQEGRKWVVDMDLEKFFDKVNHDILMERVRRKVSDPKILRLIRSFLRAGILENGLVTANEEGTPQGGPLSPLLSNIILDDLDKELERRGHKFCRYADDCNIYVKSEKAGRRVLETLTKFLEKRLRLKVNQDKSAVDNPWKRKFLGFSFSANKKNHKIRIHEKSINKFKDKIRKVFRCARGLNMEHFINKVLNPIIRGWGNYFRIAETPTVKKRLDAWIRRRLRIVLWRQWATAKTRMRKLLNAGVSYAWSHGMGNCSKGPCWMSNTRIMGKRFPPEYFKKQGLVSLKDFRKER